MCDFILNALEVTLSNLLVNEGVVLGINKGTILIYLVFEPFPDLALEVRLASQTQSLPRELLDRVEGSSVTRVAS
jgi:hypothetical protein